MKYGPEQIFSKNTGKIFVADRDGALWHYFVPNDVVGALFLASRIFVVVSENKRTITAKEILDKSQKMSAVCFSAMCMREDQERR